MDEGQVRQRIAMLVRVGELTCDEPEQTWAGSAKEAKRCAGCLEAIVAPQVEFEVALPTGQTIFLHERCHAIWVEICDELPPRPTA